MVEKALIRGTSRLRGSGVELPLQVQSNGYAVLNLNDDDSARWPVLAPRKDGTGVTVTIGDKEEEMIQFDLNRGSRMVARGDFRDFTVEIV